MKIFSLITLLLVALTTSCSTNDETSHTDHPLGVFNFDFARLGTDEASQIGELKSIGYEGLVLNLTNPKELKTLERYQSVASDDPFEVYAAYVAIDFSKDLDAQNAYLDKVTKALKKSDAKLWVILRVRGGKTVEREQIVDFLRSAADRSKAGGVELVIYPHWSGGNPLNICLIETAEDALPFVEEIGSDNLFISLHLCHEIKAGNGDRLNEVAAKIEPWLRLPSINGADVDAMNEKEGWERGIQPLTMGDYDSSQLLDALKSVDYEGPVILHTWGLQKATADHHHTSFARFQEMLEGL
jgi:sugar phosphate isomerase/epimerase